MTVKLSNPVAFQKAGNKKTYLGTPVSDTLTNGFFTVDQKWTVTYWNNASEKILGVAAKDIIGKNLWEKFAGVIPLELYAVDQKAFMQDVPVHFEEYWGEMGAWFDVITYHCGDTLSVSFKSSNHPHAEYPESPTQRLKVLTELYRFVTEITNDCLWEWDLQTQEIFWIDGGHKRALGYQVENALIPQSFWESRIHPADKERVLARLKKILQQQTETLWEEEYRFQKANGEFAYVHDRGHIIYDEDKRATRMIGATQDITEKVLLENKLLQERQTKQREITNAVITAQENERTNIRQELFENLNQMLAASKMYIEMSKKHEQKRDIYLDKSSAFIMDVMEDINRLSRNLAKPGGIMGMNMADSIKTLVDDLKSVHPMKIEFKGTGIDEANLDEKLQMTVFRIVQEQLNNIVRHANATNVIISLSRHNDQIKLLISDNGNGCDISKENTGLGIINIKSRAELYNGTVKIISKPGEGYDLRVALQYPQIIP